jgi:hypothetical protein
VGLGIPFFLVGPDIGPFAPLNRAHVLRRGVAVELNAADAERFPAALGDLRRNGRLLEMSRRGWGAPIDGFLCAAKILLDEIRVG